MKRRQLVIDIEKLAEQALTANEPHSAYILGILCGSLQRGDDAEMANAVGDFVKGAVLKQTLKQLADNIANPEASNCNFSNN